MRMRKRHSTPAPAVGPNFQKNRPPRFFVLATTKETSFAKHTASRLRLMGARTNKPNGAGNRAIQLGTSTLDHHNHATKPSIIAISNHPSAPTHAQCGRRLALVRRRQKERKRKRLFMTMATAMRKVRTSVRNTQTMPNSSVIDKRI